MVQLCKDALMPQNLKVHSRPPRRRSRRAARQAKVCAIPPRADARHFTAISPLCCCVAVSPCAAPLAATATAAGSYYCSGIVEIRKEEGEEGRREVSLVVPLFGNDDN